MKIIKNLVCMVLILALHACASSAGPVKYYTLSSAADNKVRDVEDKGNMVASRVTIGPVYLAKFLRQGGIVTRIGNHEIYMANYNRWAQPLNTAIVELLVQDLNHKTNNYQFERMAGAWNDNATFNLRLRFDKFYIRDNATVTIGGRYWLYEKKGGLKIDKTFDITHSLNQDGYPHAVDMLSRAVDELSGQIISLVNKKLVTTQ